MSEEAPSKSPATKGGRIEGYGIGVVAVVALAAVVAAATIYELARHRFVQMDEFVFVRAAWLVSQGQVPYRDFFEHHTPLLYLLLAPVVGALPERSASLVTARTVFLLLPALLGAAVYRLSRAFASRRASFAAVVLLYLVPGFVARVLEIRPDVMAVAAVVMAAALVVREGPLPRAHALAAGALVAVALLATQKSAQYAWGVGLVALAAEGRSGQGRRIDLRTAASFVAGLAVPITAFAAVLSALDAGEAFWSQNVELARRWQAVEEAFPSSRFLGHAVEGFAPWALAAVVGLVCVGVSVARDVGSRARIAKWAVIAAPALLFAAILPNLWPYNFLPVYATLTPLAAFGLAEADRRWGERRGAAALALLLIVAAILHTFWFSRERRRDNERQLSYVDRVLTLTAPGTAVFDNNGGYLFRPAAYPLWFHSKAMRALFFDRMRSEIPGAIVRSGAPVWLLDQRFDELPSSVQEFVAAHYQPYLGPIYLWGSRFRGPAEPPLEPHVFDFLAVRTGSYFVHGSNPPGVGTMTTLPDGSRYRQGEPFPLTAGRHRLRIEGEIPKAGLWVLWLPETGERWSPNRERPTMLYPYLF